MNTSKAKKATKETKERKTIEVRSAAVSNVRVVEGKNGDLVFFSLELNGVNINNCRIAMSKNGDFVSFPQYKGTNGQYYNTVYVALSDEDTKKIVADVQDAIDNM